MCYSCLCGENDDLCIFLPVSRRADSWGWGREALTYTEFVQGIRRGIVAEWLQELSSQTYGNVYIRGWKIQTIKKITSGCLDLLLVGDRLPALVGHATAIIK